MPTETENQKQNQVQNPTLQILSLALCTTPVVTSLSLLLLVPRVEGSSIQVDLSSRGCAEGKLQDWWLDCWLVFLMTFLKGASIMSKNFGETQT